MKLDMTLASLGLSTKPDFQAAKTRLLHDADAAFHDLDKDLCLDAISKLYAICDMEFEGKRPSEAAALDQAAMR